MNIKRSLQYLLVNDGCWYILKPFVYAAKRLQLSRENFLIRKKDDANIALCNQLFKSRKVLHGLFSGLNMGNIEAQGSSINAKLLGSYEMEIISEMESLLKNKYSFLFNIGSDEGYYAIGITRLQPGIKTIAFDCNKKAQVNCKALAVLNKVEENITIKGCFQEKDLPEISEKALFIIDCEGCENEIITPQLIKQFPTADFVIELHFIQNPLISDKLQNLFVHTHTVKLVKALSDHERVMQYQFPELRELSYEQKMFILNERNTFMQWLIATPKEISV